VSTEAPPAPGEEQTAEAPNGDDGAATPPTPPADLGNREPDPQPDDEVQDGLFLAGDYEIGKKVGGRRPDGAVLKLKGTKIELGESQFNRGDRLVTALTVQVTGDNDQDTIDKLSGTVKSTSKAQSATVCMAARLEEFLASKIIDDDLLAKVCFEADLPLPQRLQDGSAE
jgi:hypothetical protein